MTTRWQKTSEAVKTISAEKVRNETLMLCGVCTVTIIKIFLRFQDIASFISAITIPDYVPVTRHNFAAPPPKEITKV